MRAATVTLTLRTMNRHARLMGWGDHWGEDDYVVLDQGRSVGRIYKEVHGDTRWCWSINTSPYPAPAPRNGITKTLDSAKPSNSKPGTRK
jgi:hypothetical protein